MEFKTPLKNYNLWYDGSIEVDADKIQNYFLKGVSVDRLFTKEITDDIKKFNRISSKKISIKSELDQERLQFDWKIPNKYLHLNLNEYLSEMFVEQHEGLPPTEIEKRYKRFLIEYAEYEKANLGIVLKTLIYVIDTLRERNVVWGVGRGSSCASYILFMIGVHCVDSVKYDIPLEEFFKNYKNQ